MYGAANDFGGFTYSCSSENVSVIERQRLLHNGSSGMPFTTSIPYFSLSLCLVFISRLEDVIDKPTILLQTFDIGLCIVDYFMVLKGGFGFHIKDIERRFGPETLVTFNKVRFPTTTGLPQESRPRDPDKLMKITPVHSSMANPLELLRYDQQMVCTLDVPDADTCCADEARRPNRGNLHHLVRHRRNFGGLFDMQAVRKELLR